MKGIGGLNFFFLPEVLAILFLVDMQMLCSCKI